MGEKPREKKGRARPSFVPRSPQACQVSACCGGSGAMLSSNLQTSCKSILSSAHGGTWSPRRGGHNLSISHCGMQGTTNDRQSRFCDALPAIYQFCERSQRAPNSHKLPPISVPFGNLVPNPLAFLLFQTQPRLHG